MAGSAMGILRWVSAMAVSAMGSFAMAGSAMDRFRDGSFCNGDVCAA
jgi:hypothetical protein